MTKLSYFMCVKLNSLFDKEMKVYYVTQVFKRGINMKTMCPNCILLLRNTKSYLLQFLSRCVGQVS